MIAKHDIGALRQGQLEGTRSEEHCPVLEASVRDGPTRYLDNRGFFDEQDLAGAGSKGHEAKQAAATAQIEHYVIGLHDFLYRSLVAIELDAVDKVAVVLFKGIFHGRIMPLQA